MKKCECERIQLKRFCDCIDLIVGRLFCPVLILIHSKTKLKLQLTEHSTEWNLSGPLQKDIHSFNRWTDDERKNNHPFSFILTWIYPLHRWCNGFWSPIKFKWNISFGKRFASQKMGEQRTERKSRRLTIYWHGKDISRGFQWQKFLKDKKIKNAFF